MKVRLRQFKSNMKVKIWFYFTSFTLSLKLNFEKNEVLEMIKREKP